MVIDCGMIQVGGLHLAGIQDEPKSLKMIIGNKDSVAVELEVSNRGQYVMGFVRMWLNGRFLGSIEEEEMLSSYVHSLEWIGRMEEIGAGELDFGDAAAEFAWIQNDDSIHDRCLAGLGESTDDFLIRAYRKGDRLRFMWRLLDQPFHSYPGYGNELRCADIRREEFLELVKVVRAEIDG